ncbi:MAG: formate dehydrogenase accessory sulfurtransferase FdhD [Novosphingobium sp.]
MTGIRRVAATRLGLGEPGNADVIRDIVTEEPVAIEYNGFGYAVMMATPLALEDFAVGFTLSEGLVESADEIESVSVVQVDGGQVVRITLPADAMGPVVKRARTRVTESSCGLCGMDNIETVLAPLPAVTSRIMTHPVALARALADLEKHQPLGRATGAMHAAAFCLTDGEIRYAAEDVGRHNAFDKLLGALARQKIDPASGFVLLTARCSFELVEKAVRANCPLLVTVSAPTSLAVERAQQAGLALVALARPDSALIFNDPCGIFTSDGA